MNKLFTQHRKWALPLGIGMLSVLLVFIAKSSVLEPVTPIEQRPEDQAMDTAANTFRQKQDRDQAATTTVPTTTTPTSTPATAEAESAVASVPVASGPWTSATMAWLFPSKVICSAAKEYTDGRDIQFLKPEYFTILWDGTISLLTETSHGCQGYSATAAASVIGDSTHQYVTVSSSLDGLRALAASAEKRATVIQTLQTFAIDSKFTGVEIDFEDFASWDAETYAGYVKFLRELGTALHADGKKLMVDIPPIANATEQSYYKLTYADIAALPVDYIVIMAYDYQFDQGAGAPIAPNTWVAAIIQRAKQAIPDVHKLVIGLPSYSYKGPTGGFAITRLTDANLKSMPGYASAPRDPHSYERIWEYNGISYVYVDSAGLDAKRALIESYGIKYVSVWALGGNQWFSK